LADPQYGSERSERVYQYLLSAKQEADKTVSAK